MTEKQETPRSSTASPPATSGRRRTAVRDDWAPVWFTLVTHAWSSLVIVPAHPQVEASRVARALGDMAMLYDDRPIEVMEVAHAPPTTIREILRGLEERVAAGTRVLIAVSSPLADHGAVPIARAADAAVLLVPLGLTLFDDARRVMSLVGEERFIGSVTSHRS
jgi:hypothetical protein